MQVNSADITRKFAGFVLSAFKELTMGGFDLVKLKAVRVVLRTNPSKKMKT